MSGKLKVQAVSRTSIGPLVAMAEHLRSYLPGWQDTAPAEGRMRTQSDLGADLDHLAIFDGDGFLTASVENEVLGFSTAYVRSRQLVIPQIWVLPEANDQGVAEALMRRAMGYGERSGATECSAHILSGPRDQALALHFGLRPRFPVYRFILPAETAKVVGLELAKLMPGSELTADVLAKRTGAADLERMDRLARGVVRPMEHEYWLGERRLRLAKVRDAHRVAGYAYGGPGQCGPVAASTREGALAGLGWALQFAASEGVSSVSVLVPGPFEAALDQLLDAKAECVAVTEWMSRQATVSAERYILPSTTLI
jgi:hypothetical protein